MQKTIKVSVSTHEVLVKMSRDSHSSIDKVISRAIGAEGQEGTDMSVIEGNIEQLFKSSDERYAEIQAINERLERLESDDTVF